MDEDPTMAGGVGGGTTRNEPDQKTQTPMMTRIPLEMPPEMPATPTTEPTLTAQGSSAVELGGAAPSPELLGRENAESHHIDHDLEIGGPKKKSKAPLVIGIVVGILVLALGGLATWFFAFYNNPEKVAFDAIENLLTADDVTINGSVAILADEMADSSYDSVILSINSSSKFLPNSTSATLLLTPRDDNEDAEAVQLQLDAIYLEDGMAYIQVSGLMDTLEAAGFSTEASAELEAIFDTLERIDNEWWQISVSDLLDELELDDEEVEGLNEIYSCAVDAMNSDLSGELANLYRTNKFVQVERVKTIVDGAGNETSPSSGYNYYEVSLDDVALADFVNAIPETTTASEFFDCYNAAVAEYNIYEPFDASDIDEVSADDLQLPSDLKIYLEISRFGHELRSIVTEQEDGDYMTSGSILFQYQSGFAAEPDDYRPATELIDELTELFSQFQLAAVELTEADLETADIDTTTNTTSSSSAVTIDSSAVNGAIEEDDDWYYDDSDDDDYYDAEDE